MNIPFGNLTLFSLTLLYGVIMLIEGILIGLLHKQLIPLPSRVLYWIGAGLIGKEESARRFAGKPPIICAPMPLLFYASVHA